MKQLGLSTELIVDSFAGGGGASTGIEQALGHPVHIAINHDPEAVSLHAANHPYTKHFCEDIWEVNPRDVDAGRPIGLLWASPDCKHFSKAKGGAPVSKRVRGLAWVVMRWAALRKPRVIMLENVEEFTTWGPVDDEGQPIKNLRGITFKSFVRQLERQGYKVEWKELRACDFGAPTIRKRLFLIARRDGLPIIWPKPTHGKAGSGLLPYRTAADIIDWSIPCPSIFERDRPLAENTMRRIAKGIQKYVVDSPKPFIVEIANASSSPRANSVEDPLRTVTAYPKGGAFAVVDPFVVKVNHAGEQFRGQSVHQPMQTLTAKHGYAVCAPIIERSFGKSEGNSADAPLGTVTAGGGGKAALVSAFLTKFRTGAIGSDMQEPVHTITAGGHQKRPGGNGHAMGVVAAHVMKMRGQNIGHGADEPLHTVSAGGTHFAEVRAFLIKYFGTDGDPRIDDPLHTVTTKDRFGLVTIHGEDWQIVDIGMRMLTPRELYRAQGFPDDYIIDRIVVMEETEEGNWVTTEKILSKAAQVRMCGNSVSPVMSRALVAANMNESILYERPRIAA